MRSDDLVPLLARAPGPAVGYRQGVVVTWDQSQGYNTVLVGGSLLTDLNCLNPAEAAVLVPGDVVGILTIPGSWAILGRLIIPGSPEAANALGALRTATATELSLDNITSTSFAAAPSNPGPSVQIQVGASGRLQVQLTAEFSGQTAKAAANTATASGMMGFTLAGANTLAAASDRALVAGANILVNSSAVTLGVTGAATRVVNLEGLNPGLTTVTAVYRYTGNGTQISVDDRNLTVLAL